MPSEKEISSVQILPNNLSSPGCWSDLRTEIGRVSDDKVQRIDLLTPTIPAVAVLYVQIYLLCPLRPCLTDKLPRLRTRPSSPVCIPSASQGPGRHAYGPVYGSRLWSGRQPDAGAPSHAACSAVRVRSQSLPTMLREVDSGRRAVLSLSAGDSRPSSGCAAFQQWRGSRVNTHRRQVELP